MAKEQVSPAVFRFLIGSATFLACTAPPPVQSSYDRFTGRRQTTARLSVETSESGPMSPDFFTVMFSYSGNGGAIQGTILAHAPTADGWRFLRCRRVDFLADDRPIAVGNIEHDGDVGSVVLTEAVSFDIPPEDLRALSNSRRAEGRLCNTEFSLDAAARRVLRDFIVASNLPRPVQMRSDPSSTPPQSPPAPADPTNVSTQAVPPVGGQGTASTTVTSGVRVTGALEPPAPSLSFGVGECDAYLTRACACGDATVRERMCSTAGTAMEAWREALETEPSARPDIVRACSAAEQALRSVCSQ